MNNTNQTLNTFLKDCSQYTVLHEASYNNENIEHYFIFIAQQDVKDQEVKNIFNDYEKKYPLLDVSESSKNYMKEKREYFYFIYIDSLNKKDLFFQENEKALKENVHNIISLRMIGEPIDLTTQLGTYAEKYLAQVKKISFSLGAILKEEVDKGIKIGVTKINKNKPFIKEKIKGFKNRLFKKS